MYDVCVCIYVCMYVCLLHACAIVHIQHVHSKTGVGDRTKLLRRAIQSLEDRGVDGQSAVAAHANRNLLDS